MPSGLMALFIFPSVQVHEASNESHLQGHHVGDAAHESMKTPAASSRDLQLEVEEAEAPFIHEELDRQGHSSLKA